MNRFQLNNFVSKNEGFKIKAFIGKRNQFSSSKVSTSKIEKELVAPMTGPPVEIAVSIKTTKKDNVNQSQEKYSDRKDSTIRK
jgi:hypothetical protein